MKEKKTGIEIRETDKVQPYRVWYNGYIDGFTKTRGGAEERLKLAKRR